MGGKIRGNVQEIPRCEEGARRVSPGNWQHVITSIVEGFSTLYPGCSFLFELADDEGAFVALRNEGYSLRLRCFDITSQIMRLLNCRKSRDPLYQHESG